MDVWFQEFKVRTDSSAQTLFETSVYEFIKVLVDHQDDGQIEIKTTTLTNDDILAIINWPWWSN